MRKAMSDKRRTTSSGHDGAARWVETMDDSRQLAACSSQHWSDAAPCTRETELE